MFFTENFALPVPEPQLGIHLLHGLNQALSHSAPDMELTPTRGQVTLDTLSVSLLAEVAKVPELCWVQGATVHLKLSVPILEPNLVDPVDAGYMNPLFGLELNQSSIDVRAEHAVWESRTLVSKHEDASLAVPGCVIVIRLIIQVFTVAARMHNNLAKVTNR